VAPSIQSRVMDLMSHGYFDPVGVAAILGVEMTEVTTVLADPAYVPPPAPSPGASFAPLLYTQATPATTITLAHGLGRVVAVACYDQGGNQVSVGVKALDANTVQITTDVGLAFSGTIMVV
jgi:hypothetical protein